MRTVEVFGLSGIYVMYLCDAVPTAEVKAGGHDNMRIVTVPESDHEGLLDYLDDRGYEYRTI